MDNDDKRIRDLLSRATPINDNDINNRHQGININIYRNRTVFLAGSTLTAIIAILILAVFFY